MFKRMEDDDLEKRHMNNVVDLNRYRAARRDCANNQTGTKNSITVDPGIEFLTGQSAIEALYTRAAQDDSWRRLGEVCDQAIDHINRR